MRTVTHDIGALAKAIRKVFPQYSAVCKEHLRVYYPIPATATGAKLKYNIEYFTRRLVETGVLVRLGRGMYQVK